MTGNKQDETAPGADENSRRRKQEEGAQILPFTPRPARPPRNPAPFQPPEPPSAA